MGKKRLYNIDLIKGFLIISVIIGHIVPGKVENTFIRYMIYSFHMPIFIAVSGFLVNINTLAKMSFRDIAGKYFARLLIPWGIAVIIYNMALHYASLSSMDAGGIVKFFIKAFVKPYYHLWFILGFLSYIIITWLLLKLHFRNWMIVAAAVVISIISKFEWYHISNETAAKAVDIFHYDFRIYNYLFFVLGMLLKNRMSQSTASADLPSRKAVPGTLIKPAVILTFIGAAITIYFFRHGNAFEKRCMYYLLNIPFAVMLLGLSCRDYFPRCRAVEYIGRNSMAFYLWHVTAKLAAAALAGQGNGILYYTYSLLLLGLLYALIYLLSGVTFINRYLFGALRKTLS